MFFSVSYAVQCSLVLVGEVFTFVCKRLYMCSFCAELAYILGGGGGGGGVDHFCTSCNDLKLNCCLYRGGGVWE